MTVGDWVAYKTQGRIFIGEVARVMTDPERYALIYRGGRTPIVFAHEVIESRPPVQGAP